MTYLAGFPMEKKWNKAKTPIENLEQTIGFDPLNPALMDLEWFDKCPNRKKIRFGMDSKLIFLRYLRVQGRLNMSQW